MRCKFFRRALSLTSAVLTAGAQTLSITPDSTALVPAGGTVAFEVNATFAGSAETDLVVTLPTGWSYVTGSGELTLEPTFGTQRTLQWSGSAPLPSPINFSFSVA